MATEPTLPGLDAPQLLQAAARHAPSPGIRYVYGTAGFRTVATVLDSVLFRVGLLAVLRSKQLKGKTIGVMVTASHNPEQDNGVKLVDPRGEMLQASWELHATALANAGGPEGLLKALIGLSQLEGIDLAVPASVVYGHDTRPSCPLLVASLEDGMRSLPAVRLVPAGLKTTPQLHYLVRCLNEQGTPDPYGAPTEEGYYKKLAAAFASLNKGKSAQSPLTVDCANGVGAPKLGTLLPYLEAEAAPLRVTVVGNDISTPGALNTGCGADYVKTKQTAPPAISLQPLARHCSYDGDADRIVFYYSDEAGQFRLLDGDKIAGLAAMYLGALAKEAGVAVNLGVVQTAYANGSSTRYLQDVLNLPVACTPTGVKYLHHAAEAFDIGVYFEANGHGTVLFSPAFVSRLKASSGSTPTQRAAIDNLLHFHDLINQTVGDAISDMLLVESILLQKSWTPADWDAAYTDLPNRLVKVIVADRHAFTTTDAERKLVTPAGLQDLIDRAVARVRLGRSFVRPSGTEDCVRVYAEAATRQEADTLAFTVAGSVFDRYGKGPKPAEFL